MPTFEQEVRESRRAFVFGRPYLKHVGFTDEQIEAALSSDGYVGTMYGDDWYIPLFIPSE